MSRLVYIANTRLPTEKAHGYQICKMCEAFAKYGAAVLLLHPWRRQSDSALRGQSVFEYYGIRHVFEVRTLPNVDVVPLDRFFPKGSFTPLFFMHAFLWALYAAMAARSENADIYYTRDSAVAYWLVRFGLPTVYEAHVVPRRGQRWVLQRITEKRSLRLVVTLTSFIKERFAEMGFPAEKVVVLPDGVDLSHFEALPGKKDCRRRLELPQNRPIIGYIGRFRTLEMEKGIPELVQAMTYLGPVNGAEPLLLCVGGPMEAVPNYLDLAERFGVPRQRIQFVDRVHNREVPYWLRTFDLAVAPFPYTEHYAYFMSPLKLFEYMAAGVPIVASDLPSIREVLEHGENAWLVEPGNPKALADGIREVLGNGVLSSKMANQARLEVSQYTWQHRAEIIRKHVIQES